MPAGVSLGTIWTTIQVLDDVSPTVARMSQNLDTTGKHVDSLTKKVAVFGATLAVNFAENLNTSAARLESFGKKALIAGAALPVLGVGFAKVATDLNSSIANVTSLLGDLSDVEMAETVDSMRGSIQALAVETGSSTRNVTDGLYEVVSALGLTEDSFAQLELATKAGVAGLSTTQQSFQLLSAVTKAYGDTSAEAFTKVSDLAFQTVKLGQTTYPELAASIGQVAPIADAMGVSMEELFAITATAAGQTGGTAEVMTQMASAMAGLASPTEDLSKFLKTLGFASGEAAIAQLGLAGTLDKITSHSKATGIAVKDLLGRKEAWLLTTGLAGEKMDIFNEKMQAMGVATAASGGILQQAFDRQANGVNAVGFAWNRLQVSIKVVTEKIGELFVPIFGVVIKVLQFGVDIVNKLVDVLTWMATAVRVVMVGFSTFAATLGIVAIAIGKVISGVIILLAVLTKIAIHIVVMGVLKSAFSVLTAAIAGQAGWWVLTAAKAKVLTLAYGRLAAATRLVTATTGGWVLLATGAAMAGAKLGHAMLEIGDNIQGTNDATRDAIRNTSLLEGGWILLTDLIEGVPNLFDAIFASMGPFMEGFGNALKRVIGFAGFFGTGLFSAVSILGDGFNYLGNALYRVEEATATAMSGMTAFQKEMGAVNDEMQKRNEEILRGIELEAQLGKKDVDFEALVDKSYEADIIKKAQDIVGETVKVTELTTAYQILAITEARAAVNKESQEAAVEAITGLKAKAKALADAKTATEAAATAAKDYAEAVDQLAESMSGIPDLKTVFQTMEALGKVDLSKIPDDKIESLAKQFTAWAKAGIALDPAMKTIVEAAKLLKAETAALALTTKDETASWEEQDRILALLGGGVAELQGSFEDIHKSIKANGGVLGLDNVKLMESIRQLEALAIAAEKDGVEIEGLGKTLLELLHKASIEGLNLEGVLDGLPDPVAETVDQISVMEMGLTGVSLLAGAIGGQFGEMLQAVDGIGRGFEKWDDEATTSRDKFNMVAGAVGQIGGVIGGKTGGVMSGAAGGAMAGAAVGSIVPVVGTAVGAVVGGVVGGVAGWIGAKKDEEEARQQQMEDSLNRLEDTAQQIEDLINEKLSAGVTGLSTMFGRLAADTDLTQERLDNMGVIGIAMFQALRDEGYSVVEAMDAIGASLDQALAIADEQGLQLMGSFGALAGFRDLVMNNQDLVSGVEAISEVFTALQMTGNLTQEVFDALKVEMLTGYDDLIAQGFTANQALALMAPTLLEIKNAAESGQIAIDAETQALIDQAETAGLFEGLEDPMDKLVELQELMLLTVTALVEVFGGQLPAAVQLYIDSLRQIPTVPSHPGAPGSGGASVPNVPTLPPPPGGPRPGPGADEFGQQGFFSPSMPVGPRAGGGTNLQVHPGERVEVTPAGASRGEVAAPPQEQMLQIIVEIGGEKMYDQFTKATKTGQIRVHPDGVKAF